MNFGIPLGGQEACRKLREPRTDETDSRRLFSDQLLADHPPTVQLVADCSEAGSSPSHQLSVALFPTSHQPRTSPGSPLLCPAGSPRPCDRFPSSWSP